MKHCDDGRHPSHQLTRYYVPFCTWGLEILISFETHKVVFLWNARKFIEEVMLRRGEGEANTRQRRGHGKG